MPRLRYPSWFDFGLSDSISNTDFMYCTALYLPMAYLMTLFVAQNARPEWLDYEITMN
jgi:hypothetical protein